jgi:glycosyltransferase involved in cell wall biosynthesis
LYVASDQIIPGATGGSVHVLEVARGLFARGHQVDVVVRRGPEPGDPEAAMGVAWHAVQWWPSSRVFRFRARRAVAAIAERTRPDVVMERYYNFGGEGIQVAIARGLPSLLEINAPVVDHPGSLKARLDALTIVRPMRRYRDYLCAHASALVSPLLAIVPARDQEKTQIVTWGANVDAFRPDRRSDALRAAWGVPKGGVVVVFSSSFRPWHGAHVLEAAARRLREREDIFFLFVGPDGNDNDRADLGLRGKRLGPLPYERMPETIASADIGVAPYDTSRLSQLQLGFFWSPLKIFEYMASGLPTITLSLSPLDEIARADREGLSFREGDPADLAAAIVRLVDDAPLRARLGESARGRVVERYSWARHCGQLEAVLERIVS